MTDSKNTDTNTGSEQELSPEARIALMALTDGLATVKALSEETGFSTVTVKARLADAGMETPAGRLASNTRGRPQFLFDHDLALSAIFGEGAEPVTDEVEIGTPDEQIAAEKLARAA